MSSEKWPGTANLEVSKVWARRGLWGGMHVLDGRPVRAIGPFLTVPGRVQGNPYSLIANIGKSFQGSNLRGIGFVVSPEEAERWIQEDPRNRDVLFPYLNGEDLNSRPDQSPSRWVINFFDWPQSRAESYPIPFQRLVEEVLPARQQIKHEGTRKKGVEKFWIYDSIGRNLYEAIAGMERVLVHPFTSKHHCLAFSNDLSTVFSHMTVVFALQESKAYSLLQSGLHWEWVLAYGNKLENRPQYSSSDCFETFPFPTTLAGLEAIGEACHEHRRLLMLEHQEGLTKTYNRFHGPAEKRPDILRLRELHVQMDQAVAAAYGWQDLDLGHGFHDTPQGLRYTLSEPARREVLDRLLELNHQRHAEEVAQGLHDKGKPKPKPGGGKARKKNPPPREDEGGQLDLGL